MFISLKQGYIKGCENETHFISGLLKSFDEKVKIVDSYVATRLNGYTGSWWGPYFENF